MHKIIILAVLLTSLLNADDEYTRALKQIEDKYIYSKLMAAKSYNDRLQLKKKNAVLNKDLGLTKKVGAEIEALKRSLNFVGVRMSNGHPAFQPKKAVHKIKKAKSK